MRCPLLPVALLLSGCLGGPSHTYAYVNDEPPDPGFRAAYEAERECGDQVARTQKTIQQCLFDKGWGLKKFPAGPWFGGLSW